MRNKLAFAGIVGGLIAAFVLACGGGKPQAVTAPAVAPDAAPADAAPPDAADAAVEKPFAGSAAEATQLVSAAVDKRTRDVNECVRQYRFRKHLAHERVSIQVGIDQEGNVIGVTVPKGLPEPELSACVQNVLKTAVFPRSHSGVITVTRTFEEIVQ